MKNYIENLEKYELVRLKLEKLYKDFGYKKVKLSTFENYELYVDNNEYLDIKSVINFMDKNGDLLVLRPDVTLSIVKKLKNEKPNNFEKIFYEENIYRLSKTKEFKEKRQVGVEYFGKKDEYSNIEIVNLILESLKIIDDKYILDISHLGYLIGLFEEIDLSNSQKNEILNIFRKKSQHELEIILNELNIEDKFKIVLLELLNVSGNFKEAVGKLAKMSLNKKMREAVEELEDFYDKIEESEKDKIWLDFSIIEDVNYYNGLIFQGYIEKSSNIILTGGRYDNLTKKIGLDLEAVGFAIDLTELEDYYDENRKDFNILILYDEVNVKVLIEEVKKLNEKGFTVRVERDNENFQENYFNYDEKYYYKNGELTKDEVTK